MISPLPALLERIAGRRVLVLGDVILGPYVQRLPEAERIAFAQRVLDELDDPPVLDYVRLNITARKV